jgi:hypothetical protein
MLVARLFMALVPMENFTFKAAWNGKDVHSKLLQNA